MEKNQRLLETEKALIEYAETYGWPSQKEWNKYAEEHGYFNVPSLYYYTKELWSQIRDRLGFKPRKHHFTKEECIDAIIRASQEYGIFLTQNQYEDWIKLNPENPGLGVVHGRFGSWNTAKIEAGLIPNNSPGLSKEFTETELLEALKKCATALASDLFTEAEYMAWRANNPDIPHIETVRKKLGGLPEAKRKMGLRSYDAGFQDPIWSDGQWKKPLLDFLCNQVSVSSYREWAKQNNGPCTDIFYEYAEGWDKALIECLELLIIKIKEGRYMF